MASTRVINFLFTASLSLHAADLPVERIFGKEIATGPYKHPACATELHNGDIYLVYYGGAGEYAVKTGVFGSRKKKGGTNWSAPRLLASDPFRSVGNGVIWQSPDGIVWLFYVVRYGDTWSTSRIQAKVSKDNAETWSDSFVVAQEPGMMVRNKPIVLSSGEYLLPIYHETGEDREVVGPESTSRFLRFDPKKDSEWKPSGIIRSAKGNIQPAPVEVSKDYLVAYCRRGGGYGKGAEGWLVRSESRDGGRTWSEGKDSAFPNPNSAVDFLKLASGNLLLVYNDSGTERVPLTVALSDDSDKSYKFKRNAGTKPDGYAYPIAFQARDGKIHIIFTSKGRTEINQITFDESWVKAN